jgi:hypothetical protein
LLQCDHKGCVGSGGTRWRSDGKMRPLLLVFSFAWIVLVPAPALAQTSPDGTFAAGAQYNQYDGQESGVGGRAAHDAIVASGAIRATSEEAAGGNSVSAAELSNSTNERDAAFAEEGDARASTEAQNASANIAEVQNVSASNVGAQGESANTPGFEKLPHTGGPSPLWLFGAPLVCVGGVLARRVLLA